MSMTATASSLDPPATFSTSLDLFYGSVLILCLVIGVLGNLAALIYFISKESDLSNTIYKCVATNDLVISLACAPVGISYLSKSRDIGVVFGSGPGCYIWIQMWYTGYRVSIFLVVVLSFSRTLSMLKPFLQQNVRAVLGVIVGYSLGTLTSFIALEMLPELEIGFERGFVSCGLMISVDYYKDASAGTVLVLIEAGMILTLIIEFLVVLITAAMSCYLLVFRKSRVPSTCQRLHQSRIRATVTIMIFALVYIIFNVPLVLKVILQFIDSYLGGKTLAFDWTSPPYVAYFSNFVQIVSVAMNSAINPLIYLWRMESFRRFLRF